MFPIDPILTILSYCDSTDLRNMRAISREFNEHIIKIIGNRYKNYVHESWLPMISRQASQTYFGFITRKFDLSMDLIFKCLLTPLDSIRVVIVGDKPHRFSDGYAFSANDGFSLYQSSTGRIIEEKIGNDLQTKYYKPLLVITIILYLCYGGATRETQKNLSLAIT